MHGREPIPFGPLTANQLLRLNHGKQLTGLPRFAKAKQKSGTHQKINQQTCDPNEIEVKSPKTRGRQLSIKDISSVTPEPTRGWDESATTTKIMFV